jgi:hypothetical protein
MDERDPKTGWYCEIRVDGHLDEARLQQFRVMQLILLPEGDTVISGEMADQAALFGLLIIIRDLGIPLISVTCEELK